MSKKNIYLRRPTHPVRVGTTIIGGENAVVVQTMTDTSTLDTENTVRQIVDCVQAGAKIVRMTAQGTAHAANLANIKNSLADTGLQVDLVADIHFNPAAAYEAAKHVEKVRINPGNFVDPGRVFKKIEYTDAEYRAEIERLKDAFIPFLEHCRKHGTAIRLGVNHGSLSDRIMSRYGDTERGMVESAMEFLRIAVDNKFSDIVISIKASNVLTMTRTVRLLVQTMEKEKMTFPLHLGVTEAGDAEDGRVKSAVGIGSLLADGIGDTIRVSLSEPPQNEIPVANMILRHIDLLKKGKNYIETIRAGIPVSTHIPLPYVVGRDTDTPAGGTLLKATYPKTWTKQQIMIGASIDLGRVLLSDKHIDGIQIVAPGKSKEFVDSLALSILQATRKRISKTEFIACPGCGRTLFDLKSALARVKKATSHLKGLKIAVMGCIVNGPGEMADADYGYVGGATDKVSIYRGKNCVVKNVDTKDALNRLIDIIKQDNRWVDPD